MAYILLHWFPTAYRSGSVAKRDERDRASEPQGWAVPFAGSPTFRPSGRVSYNETSGQSAGVTSDPSAWVTARAPRDRWLAAVRRLQANRQSGP